ncbi:MAG TPA: PAS domain-containing protein [Streptosporangiaceae bacterium]|jgi:PAS domain-containing protein
MTAPQIDYRLVFRDLPIPILLLTRDFQIFDMNQAYLQVAGKTKGELVGRNVFAAFPDNPDDPTANGVRNLRASLEGVLATGEPDIMAVQKYDTELPDRPGVFEARYWCPVNAPIFGPDGETELLVQCVEEVTDRVRRFVEVQLKDL